MKNTKTERFLWQSQLEVDGRSTGQLCDPHRIRTGTTEVQWRRKLRAIADTQCCYVGADRQKIQRGLEEGHKAQLS